MTYTPDTLHILADETTLFESVAQVICSQAQECIKQRNIFTLTLAGGSTPANLYRLLTSAPYVDEIPWEQTHIYFGDERFVPPDHADSNYAMAKQTLFDHVPIPLQNIHPIPTDCPTANQCADQYASLLESVPSLDLVLLGMGDDGHTASLFPDTDILEVENHRAAAVYLQDKDSWRISMTYTQLNQAKNILVLISGPSKASRVKLILSEPEDSQAFPIMRLRPLGNLDWYLDSAASATDSTE